MNVDALRIADRWLGLPLCRTLTLCRRVANLFGGGKARLPAPHNILIVKLSEMGSTVLAYPALSLLRLQVREAKIFFLVFEENKAICDEIGGVAGLETIVVNTDSPLKLLTSGFRAVRRLWRERIDTTIDMDFFSRFAAALAYLVCRGNRVGFHRYTTEGLDRGDLLTHKVHYSPHIHTSDAFVALVRSLFEDPHADMLFKGRIGEADLVLPSYDPKPEALESIRGKLKAAGVEDPAVTPVFLINPNSSNIFPLRKWPRGNYEALCRRLLESKPDVRLFVTGSRSEKEEAEELVKNVGSNLCVNFAGNTTFPELLALYSLAAGMITNDSGPAHFASLLRLPTVVLFGPETPLLYRPIGDAVQCLYSGLACSPCVSVYNAKKSPCRNNVCLQQIGVDKALHAVLMLLGGRKPGQYLTQEARFL